LVSSAVRIRFAGFDGGNQLGRNLVAQSGNPQTRRFELRVENEQISQEVKPIQMQRGDSVEIDRSADQPEVKTQLLS
jgi:hypothetical protein